jgi:hypothetical protein
LSVIGWNLELIEQETILQETIGHWTSETPAGQGDAERDGIAA